MLLEVIFNLSLPDLIVKEIIMPPKGMLFSLYPDPNDWKFRCQRELGESWKFWFSVHTGVFSAGKRDQTVDNDNQLPK